MRSWCASLRGGAARCLLAVIALACLASPAFANGPGRLLDPVTRPVPSVAPAPIPKPTPLPVITPTDEHDNPTDIAADDEAAWQAYLAEAMQQPKVLGFAVQARLFGHELTGWVALCSDPTVPGDRAGWSYRRWGPRVDSLGSRDAAGRSAWCVQYQMVRGNPLWWTDPWGLAAPLHRGESLRETLARVREEEMGWFDRSVTAADQFGGGLVGAASHDMLGTRDPSDYDYGDAGQAGITVGHYAAGVAGFIEVGLGTLGVYTGAGLTGAGLATSPTGAGIPIAAAGVGTMAAGAATVGYGASTVDRAFEGLRNQSQAASEGGSGSGCPKRVTNPKHHPNSNSPEPSNVDALYADSIEDSRGVRWAIDEDGTIHRFSRPSNGETHWNGSTAGRDPIRQESIPSTIRRVLQQRRRGGR